MSNGDGNGHDGDSDTGQVPRRPEHEPLVRALNNLVMQLAWRAQSFRELSHRIGSLTTPISPEYRDDIHRELRGIGDEMHATARAFMPIYTDDDVTESLKGPK
jgi:hypothetical protein